MKNLQSFDEFVNESVDEAFKHINKNEYKIKLAIKDVEKKSRLKINRSKPPEYEQLSLNKIMLSKVLGREKLGKEHQDAWEKLMKEYDLSEFNQLIEGVMSDIHMMAKDAKTEDDFIKDFLKAYGDKVKNNPDTKKWLGDIYKDTK